MADIGSSSSRPSVRVGVLGCGNVGGAFVELIDSDAGGIRARSGVALEVSRVAVRNLAKPRRVEIAAERLTHDAHAVATDPDVDVVVELIGGIEPARTLILDALRAGKHVVTANKELLATLGSELYEVARESGCQLLFEAAVAGAIPLVRALRVSLAGERIQRVVGIVNGTTNYILSRMSEERIGYSEALREAQSLGYAERDPSADVEGFDASAKAAILASIAFNTEVVAGDVYREGIEQIGVEDIDFARRLGYVVKLLALAEAVGPDDAEAEVALDVRVHPAMVPVEHPLAGVRGPFNAVFVEGEASGELMLYGRGAGGFPTASAVLGDVLDVAQDLSAGDPRRTSPRRKSVIRPIDDLRTQYYLTVDVVDRPGVLAEVATIFGAHHVSIRSMEQVDLGARARLVFITHVAKEADVQATLAGLAHLDAVDHLGALLRVIGSEH